MSTEVLKTASVLAFERKLDPSDALFRSGKWGERENAVSWKPIVLREKSVRGTISNRLKAKDPLKLDPNPQTIDVATLPADTDTLKVQFTLRVLAGTGKPSACNNAAYQQKLEKTVTEWKKNQGFGNLAKRYAYNLANGRFLWRNRIGAEQVEVKIDRLIDDKPAISWTFDALSLSLRGFTPTETTATGLSELTQIIAAGLEGEKHVLLQVTAFVRIGNGQEVFPSQELIMDRGDKSKTLYEVQGVAAMHSQKIGNAIRTIDTWYPETEGVSAETLGPIAVEPYGSVTTEGKAYRAPSNGKRDFYNLLDNWVLKDKAPSLEDQNYVIAVLIRGGVFGEAN